MSSYGLYAVITPGNRETSWDFNIYRDCYVQTSTGQNRIWDDTQVKTSGMSRSQKRAEKRACKRIARMVKAYDMLARKGSTVE